MQLIYHKKDTEDSIFEEKILDVVKNDEIKIACPYISLNILKKWVMAKNWKFLTDINELLRSFQNKDERNEFLIFYTQNQSKIRHISSLHAKMIISNKNMFFGSANFTHSGLAKRTELSYYSEDLVLVEEVNSWFNTLWIQGEIKQSINEIKLLVTELNQKEHIKTEPIVNKIYSDFKQSKKTLRLSYNKTRLSEKNMDDETKLIETFKKFDKQWLVKFLDKANELIEFLELKPDDQTFTLNIPKNLNSLCFVIENNRYALFGKYYGSEHKSRAALMMPLDCENLIDEADKLKYSPEVGTPNIRHFKQKGRTPIKFKAEGNPKEKDWILFSDLNLSSQVFNLWKEACAKEFKHFKPVKNRNTQHNKYFYETVVNKDYREKILNRL